MKRVYDQPQIAVIGYEQSEAISAITWNDPTVSGEHNDIEVQ